MRKEQILAGRGCELSIVRREDRRRRGIRGWGVSIAFMMVGRASMAARSERGSLILRLPWGPGEVFVRGGTSGIHPTMDKLDHKYPKISNDLMVYLLSAMVNLLPQPHRVSPFPALERLIALLIRPV